MRPAFERSGAKADAGLGIVKPVLGAHRGRAFRRGNVSGALYAKTRISEYGSMDAIGVASPTRHKGSGNEPTAKAAMPVIFDTLVSASGQVGNAHLSFLVQ